MDFLRVLESIFGRIKAIIKETLNRDSEVGSATGAKLQIKAVKIIKATMQWIRSQGMENMSGTMDGSTKVSLRMIFAMAMGNFLMLKIS